LLTTSRVGNVRAFGQGVIHSQGQLWDVATGEPIDSVFQADSELLRQAEFSPDGRRILGSTGRARVWDASTGSPLASILPCGSEMRYATFSPDGRYVLVAGVGGWNAENCEARVWDIQTVRPLAQLQDHRPWTGARALFSPDGQRVLSLEELGGDVGRKSRLWDARTGQPVSPAVKHGFLDPLSQFSSDGRHVLLWHRNAPKIFVWEAATGRPLSIDLLSTDYVKNAEFSPSGDHLLIALQKGGVFVWDMIANRPRFPSIREGDFVHDARFSPDGRRLATLIGREGPTKGRPVGEARVWDAATGQPTSPPLKTLEWTSMAAFSPDGRRLVTVGYRYSDKGELIGGEARLWDAATGSPVGGAMPHADPKLAPAFNGDGCRLVTQVEKDTVQIWDTSTGQPVGPPLPHDEEWHWRFSPDGRFLLTDTKDGNVRVSNPVTGQPLAPPLLHNTINGMTWPPSFSPDGRLLVTASDPETVRVWDTTTGQSTFLPLKAIAYLARFSPDGRRLMIHDARGMRVWDVATCWPLTPVLESVRPYMAQAE
jgi:WD40 repeat protein